MQLEKVNIPPTIKLLTSALVTLTVEEIEKTKSNEFSQTIQVLASALVAIPEEEWKKLEDSRYTVEIKIVRIQEKQNKKLNNSTEDYVGIYTELQMLNNRDSGNQYLRGKFSTKSALEGFAKFLDIPISKQDKIENLREKIVDATIGAILRSKAIQGDN